MSKRIPYYEREELTKMLVGRSIVEASTEDAILVLDNGTRLEFDRSNSDCCSYIDLTCLRATNSIITDAKFQSKYEDGYEGEGAYKTRLHVLTEAGPVDVAEAEGNASNGYYLSGFALDVRVIEDDEFGWVDD